MNRQSLFLRIGVCILLCSSSSSPFFYVPVVSAADDNKTTTGATNNNSAPLFINCGGGIGKHVDALGRSWTGDDGSEFAPNFTNVSTIRTRDRTVAIPYNSARMFYSNFTYTIPVTPGRMFLRLHFKYYSPFEFSFSVVAAQFTLLKNFNLPNSVICEYSIYVSSSFLNLSFAPTPDDSKSYLAIINGIEIVPVPDILFSSTKPSLLPTVLAYVTNGPNGVINNSVALEKMVRINVGGRTIPPLNDSGLFREWEGDSEGQSYSKDKNVAIRYPNSFNQSIAPVDVYSTASSWATQSFPVDLGFLYLVRLHFCEIQYPITKAYQRVFDIFINNMTVAKAFDVIAATEAEKGGKRGIGVPFFRDFVVKTARLATTTENALSLVCAQTMKPIYNFMIRY